MTHSTDPRPVHVIVPPTESKLGPSWWRAGGFVRAFLIVVGAALVALLASASTKWSHTSLGVAGLSLDCLGIIFIALPFVSRSWIRVVSDRRIRQAEADVAAHEKDIECTEEAQASIERQRREGVPQPQAEFPDISERNFYAETLYEIRSTWRRRLLVPDEQAARFVILGTAIMVIGFLFQAAAYFK